jgi:hypothetical protein
MPCSTPKRTVYFADDSYGPGSHLYIVISNSCPKGRVLVVNLTSAENAPSCYCECLVDRDEHPSLTHLSAVAYSHAEVKSWEVIKKGIEVGVLQIREPVSNELLKKIQDGAKRSQDIPTECVAYFKYFE